jgi:L-iditol 2-dehydrogenase
MPMLAAMLKAPGSLTIENVEVPQPGPGEVLLKVDACALCGTDKRVLAGEKPVSVPIIGHEIAGTVTSVGPGVDAAIKVGGRYAVQTVIGCGDCPMCAVSRENLCEKGFTAIGYAYNGGFSESMLVPRNAVEQGCLIPIPAGMDAEVGTLLEPLSCGINGLRDIPLEGMRHVVVIGAGVIGVLNGLIARARGAKRVSIFNRSQDKLDVIAKLGLPFDDLINMSKLDPDAWIQEHTGGRGVDCVIVSASVKSLGSRGMGWLARNGHLSLFAGMPKSDCIEAIDLNLIHYRELHLHGANSSVRRDYLEAMRFLDSGKIDGKSLITHRFPLKEFAQAVKVQNDSRSGALKVIIKP